MMPTPAPEWVFENGSVALVYNTDDGHVLKFEAEGLERQRTGIHGLVKIAVQDTVIAYSRFNIEKSEDRVRLVGRACNGRTKPDQFLRNGAPMEKDGVQFIFDQFCLAAFPKYVSNHGAIYVMGDTLTDIDYIAKPYAVDEGGTILFAPPDSGKTYSGLLLAVTIDAGMEPIIDANQIPIWDIPKKRKVLFINLERGAKGLARRLGYVNAALGLDSERPLLMLNARGKTFNDLVEAVEMSVKQHKVEITFLDSISRSGQGGLSDDSAVNRLMDTMNRILPAWFALAHTPRADASHIYGSVHFDAAADIMIAAKIARRDKTAMGVKWTVTKANDVPRPQPLVIGMEFDEFGLHRAWKSSENEFPDLVEGEGKNAGLTTKIRNYLAEVDKSDASTIAVEISADRGDVSRVLNASKDFQNLGKDPRDGRKVLFGVATAQFEQSNSG